MNNLQSETSTYLRKHAIDLVNWHPWGYEALAQARKKNQLIFLSIGYSTCHWCHVMGRESFMDRDVAELLNNSFVPILVDCEERPDINAIYMKACRLMLDGYAGWPLNVVLTPNQTPVFAGVYLPAKDSGNRQGLLQILGRLDDHWRICPDLLRVKGKKMKARLSDQGGLWNENLKINTHTFETAKRNFYDEFDSENGGFGPDPRFVRPYGLMFLMHRFWRRNKPELLAMAEKSLTSICRGGITDQIGGGVHRYSTDVFWRIPHFEKMIYDQAGLILACSEAYQITGRQMYADSIQKTVEYVFREMTAPEGVFFSGEDADIGDVEGKHFVWTRAEILEELGEKDGLMFCETFGVTSDGNFRKSADGLGTNVLYMKKTPAEWTTETGDRSPIEIYQQLEGYRKKLLARRLKRPLPEKDRQVIVSWNALMISAMARAGQTLGNPAYIEAATRAADFIWGSMRSDGRLDHCLKKKETRIKAFAMDYAFFAESLLDLYEYTFDTVRLRQALELTREMIRLFWDENKGGLFEVAEDSESLIVRLKGIEEREMPSTNGAALKLFGRLWLTTGNEEWQARALSIISVFAGKVSKMPGDFPGFLMGASRLTEPARRVCIVGRLGDDSTTRFIETVRSIYAPDLILLHRPPEENDETILHLAPVLREMQQIKGKTTAYMCDNFACHPPVTKPDDLRSLLSRSESLQR